MKLLLIVCLSWVAIFGANLFDPFIDSADSQFFLSALLDYDEALYEKTIDELEVLRDHYDFFPGIEEGNFCPVVPNKKPIPQQIHLIWLGPKRFPIASIPLLRSLIDLHPNYKIIFWTDRQRKLEKLPLAYRHKLTFAEADQIDTILKKDLVVKKLFASSLNPAEQSDLLRYLILFQIGGVYIDHDVRLVKPLDPLVDHLSFFCFCDRLYGMVLQQYLKFSNAVIGSCPGNQLIQQTLDLVKARWDEWTTFFNQINIAAFGLDQNRQLYGHSVLLKTFIPFTLVLKKATLTPYEVILPPQLMQKLPVEGCEHMFGYHRAALTWWQTDD